MFVTIINDCQGYNEIGRQETRVASLFPGAAVSFMGVSSDFSVNATLESAGHLIDVLDAAEDRKGIILLNVAPRGEQKKDGHNGTAFSYFRYKEVLVISTVKGNSLSLVKKLGLVDEIKVVDVETVCNWAVEKSLLRADLRDYIVTTQFRSFDFVPRLARWLEDEGEVPHETLSMQNIDDIDNCVWLIDAFGNMKTTLTKKDIPVEAGEKLQTNLGTFTFYNRLKDLPKGETGMYLGSSGIGFTRFVEFATQKTAGSAAKVLHGKIGQVIEIMS